MQIAQRAPCAIAADSDTAQAVPVDFALLPGGEIIHAFFGQAKTLSLIFDQADQDQRQERTAQENRHDAPALHPPRIEKRKNQPKRHIVLWTTRLIAVFERLVRHELVPVHPRLHLTPKGRDKVSKAPGGAAIARR